jgi:hypothetical protein
VARSPEQATATHAISSSVRHVVMVPSRRRHRLRFALAAIIGATRWGLKVDRRAATTAGYDRPGT